MLAFEEVFLWSVFLSFVVAVIYRVLTKPAEIRKIKEDLKYFKDEANKAQKAGNTKKAQELMNEMMKQSSKQLRASMKPMFATLIIFALILGYLATTYKDLVVNLPFSVPFIGMELNWLGWYIIAAMPFTWIFRKALGVE